MNALYLRRACLIAAFFTTVAVVIWSFRLAPIPVHLDSINPDSDLCRVHGRIRVPAVVPILYGYYSKADPVDYYEAYTRDFPNSWRELYGGCELISIPGRESPTQGAIRYCPRCREAEQRWLTLNAKPKA